MILLIISVYIRLRSIYLLLLSMPLIFHYFIEFAHGYFANSEGVIEPLKHLAVMLSIFVIIIVYNRLNNKS